MKMTLIFSWNFGGPASEKPGASLEPLFFWRYFFAMHKKTNEDAVF